MVVLTFAGGAMAARSNENIRISFLEHKVGPVGRRILYTVQWIISLIVLVAVTWYGALLALEEYEWDSLSAGLDRKSTRLNSSHVAISYAVFCLKKKRL